MAALATTLVTAIKSAPILTQISTALGATGSVIGAVGAAQQGKAAQAQAEAEAKQADALAQQEAENRRKEGALLQSRQRAVAAAQGGSADASVLALLGDTAAETERAALTDIYRGRTAAEGARYRGQVARQQGRIGAFGSVLSGVGGAIGSAASAFDRFGEAAQPAPTATNRFRYG